jgi:hypothetical protein
MKKVACIIFITLSSGCANMQPVDMSFEVNALGGLIKVKPSFTVGDGRVGPTSVQVETEESSMEVVPPDAG